MSKIAVYVSKHDHEEADLSPNVRRPLDLKVDLTQNRRVIVLSLDVAEDDKKDQNDFHYALSAPQAAQLSRLLREAVEKHLDPEAN